MRKKIIIVSFLIAIMLLSTPVISSTKLNNIEQIPDDNCALCASGGGLKSFICGWFMGIALTIFGCIIEEEDPVKLEEYQDALEIVLGIMILLRCPREFFPDAN